MTGQIPFCTLRRRGNIEEKNIHYVAVTRAKNKLVWVEGVEEKKNQE